MKKRVLLVLALLLGFLFFSRSAFAESSVQPVNTSYDQKELHIYTQNVLISVMAAVSCQLTGVDPVNPQGKCLGVDPQSGKIGFVEGGGGGGAIGMMGGLISMTFNVPVSTHDYVSNLASNFGIAKNTYAQDITSEQGGGKQAQQGGALQGMGFGGLRPVLKIWQEFRNIVYFLFVLLFLIVGLGIMFRFKIDPRTVMTLQNQLPKIVVALIFVTFSYAIAGFLIDLMYITMYLVFGAFAKVTSIQTFNPTILQNSNPLSAIGGFGSVGKIASNASFNVAGIIESLFDGRTGHVLSVLFGGLLGALGLFGGVLAIFTIPAGLIAGIAGGSKVIGVVAGLIAFLIFAIALLIALFRLWFTLLKAYIYILLDVVLAPFWIAFGLFPGSPIGFGMWLRDIVSNLAAFPATLMMLLLAKIFIEQFAETKGGFVPPFIGNPGDLKAFGALIGVAVIILTPEVVNITKQVIKAPQNKYGAAVSQGIRTGSPMTALGTGGQIGSAWFGISHLKSLPFVNKVFGEH